jgi:signal transduction histidine kinase
LIIDDDRAALTALQSLLIDEGYLVEQAGSGAEALAMVQVNPPDVVLTDLRMPEISGIRLCSKLHELNPELPVIVVTGMADTAAAVDALRAGAEDFLTKPVDVGALLVSVERATKRRAANVEREQLRRRTDAMYQQTVAAVRAHEEVLEVVSHDLRNPLGVIVMGAHRLRNLTTELGPSHEVGAIAASIIRNANLMEHLIADLLDESRVRTGRLSVLAEPVSVNELLASAAELRPLAQRKGIVIRVAALERDRLIDCDRLRMIQVLDNLLGNAIKFSPNDSTVTLCSATVEGGVRFSVRDQGPGISPAAIARIFERFWQSKEASTGGIGLGLYIVRGIVETHGGKISVESKLGVGTVFHVFIPDRSVPEQLFGIQAAGEPLRLVADSQSSQVIALEAAVVGARSDAGYTRSQSSAQSPRS